VKSELGKLRIAVAGDLLTYLQMTWVLKLLNGAYKQWPGSTIEETFVEQTKRMARMLELCERCFGLPFDYAGFDHQPEREEIVAIWQHMIDSAQINVPEHERDDYYEITRRTVDAFTTATLEARDDEAGSQVHLFPVKGGLMSGLRITTTVGNAWNTIMTGLALKLLNQIGVSTDDIERYIRGDDSAIFTPTSSKGAFVKIGYDIIGVKGGEGKFSLQHGQMEFLRVWYTSQCCSGYPLRALPNLVQRKPWASEAWTPDQVLRAIYETIRTLRRRIPHRVVALDRLWNSLAASWCRDHNIPRAALRAPVHMGGLAIEGGVSVAERIVPRVHTVVEMPPIKVLNQTTWRANRKIDYYRATYNVELSAHRAGELAHNQLMSTMLADDIPVVAKECRKAWKEEMAGRTYSVELVQDRIQHTPLLFDPSVYPLSEIDLMMTVLEERTPLFGNYPEVQTGLQDYHELEPDCTLTEWLQQHYPRAAAALTYFHSSWFIAEKLDYLSGKLPIVASVLHPALNNVWQKMVASVYSPRRPLERASMQMRAAGIEASARARAQGSRPLQS